MWLPRIMCRPIARPTHTVAEAFTACAAVHYLGWKKQFLALFTVRVFTIGLLTCRYNRAAVLLCYAVAAEIYLLASAKRQHINGASL